VKLDFELELARGAFHFRAADTLTAPVTGVFGPSGSGKTTLLHLIAGLAIPQRGRLSLDGRVLLDRERGLCRRPEQRRIGLVFQDGRLFPHLDVTDNLRYGLRLLPPAQRRFSLDEICAWLELDGLRRQRPHTLSGGERQRVALGRALLQSPHLLLLDEPLASLDRGYKLQILPLLRRIKHQTGIPMIYVSHDLSELLQLTDELLIVKAGGLLGRGTLTDLLRDQAVLDLIHDLGLLNVVPARIDRHEISEGITHYQVGAISGECRPWVGPLHENAGSDACFLSLRPEDIALVRETVSGISIQNQVRGRIVRLMQSRHKALCLVDVGIDLLVEVTPHAIHELTLTEGEHITCLFKAQALRVLS
jgi:molybdate transport system ATP-binding protein